MTVSDIVVDVCRGGCGGMWFDHLELGKLDDQEEAAGAELLAVPREPAVRVAHEAPWGCPRCGHPAMMRRFYSPARAIEIDECPRCGGIWLDAGELATIRAQYASQADRKAAHSQAARDIYKRQVAELEAEFAAEDADAEQGGLLSVVHRLLRFL